MDGFCFSCSREKRSAFLRATTRFRATTTSRARRRARVSNNGAPSHTHTHNLKALEDYEGALEDMEAVLKLRATTRGEREVGDKNAAFAKAAPLGLVVVCFCFPKRTRNAARVSWRALGCGATCANWRTTRRGRVGGGWRRGVGALWPRRTARRASSPPRRRPCARAASRTQPPSRSTSRTRAASCASVHNHRPRFVEFRTVF